MRKTMKTKWFNSRFELPGWVCLLFLGLLISFSAPAAVVNVAVGNNSNTFSPLSVTITTNDQVRWIWSDDALNVTHSTTSTNQAKLWDSGIHPPPFVFTVTFTNAGKFAYFCTVHAQNNMTGVVEVVIAGNVPPTITTQPANQTVIEGDTVTFSVAATGTLPLSYQWKKAGANIPGATSESLTLIDVSAAGAGVYSVVVSNIVGSITSASATLTVNSGKTAPVITTQPKGRNIVPGRTATLTVVATGTAPLSYQWQKDGTDILGGTNASLTLSAVTAADAGIYTVKVSNSQGSVTSAEATVTTDDGKSAPVITIQPAGRTVKVGANVVLVQVAIGTTPLSYQWRRDGEDIEGATKFALAFSNVQETDSGTYSVRVSNDLGSVDSADAVLTVEPITTATFLKGTYSGIFSDPNGVEQQSSGSLSINMTAKGKFSGKLQKGAAKASISGQFDVAGHIQKLIPVAGGAPLTVDLQLDLINPDHLTGAVSNQSFTADLVGNRAVYDGKLHPAPQAGRYTLLIPGADDNSNSTPDGDSFGTLTVDKAGRIRLAGSLADSTKISQSVTLSKNADWPLYIPLYGGGGSIMSWLKFGDASTSDVSGEVVWIKPNVLTARLYPGGFKFSTPARGSHYQGTTASGNLLTFTDGQVALIGGDLAGSITNLISIGVRNRVTNFSPNKLYLTFAPSTGLFSGRVVDPASGRPVPFSGVILQKEDAGFGWFSGPGHSGPVILSER